MDAITETNSDTQPDSNTDADVDTDQEPTPSMSFFVTSVGTGEWGGNLFGLIGADERCQTHAENVGAGEKTWHAYLSSSEENARDRIGTGPWYNFNVDMIATDVDSLHTDYLPIDLALTELGELVPPLEHDILTGSLSDGTTAGDLTCLEKYKSQTPALDT